MYGIVVVALAGWLMVGWMGMTTRHIEAQQTVVKGESDALNFLNYRDAVVRYLNANAMTNGTVADGALTWNTGFVRDARWTNVIASSELYVYSVNKPSPAVVNAIAEKTWKAQTIGIKDTSGLLTTVTGQTVGITLPASIPTGALVYIGK